MAEPEILTTRGLNRALLARQMLLERVDRPLVDVVEGMGGIQNQYAPSGYISLRSRMRGFTRPMLTEALEERRVVQGTIMRATIHAVSAADYWPMTIGVRRARREWFERTVGHDARRLDAAAAAQAVREVLAGGALPMRELTERIVARGFPAEATRWAAMWVDLVRVPPSGTWDRRRADLYGLAETWVPMTAACTEADGIAHLVRRYLGAFGPAPTKDVASWMGMKVGPVNDIVAGMGLRELRDESGVRLFDLDAAPLPDEATPAPARFLPVWDATLLVHARRTAVLPEALRPKVFSVRNPQSVNTFLVDGQVAGTWRHEAGEIRLDPLRPLTRAERVEVEQEAHHMEELYR